MEHYHLAFKAMGCPCEIQLYSASADQARNLADAVTADIQRLEAKYSRYRDDSLLSTLNRVAASGGCIRVDEETAGLLNYAQTCYEQSDGLFDITSGILRQAWRFDRTQLPDEALISTLRDYIGWNKLRWQAPLLEFPQPGLELDFGGIVKEYAVDRAATLCLQGGIQHGIINLGGDVRLLGGRPNGEAWRVGIAHPRDPGATVVTLALRQGAVASSGDYERCLIVDGVRYGHILNPLTGCPVRHLAAVTVLAEHCVVAGSASTIAMLKEEAGPEWLQSLGLPHLWMDVAGRLGGSAHLLEQSSATGADFDKFP